MTQISDNESFRPVSSTPPTGLIGSLKFYARMIVDFQFFSIYTTLKRNLPHWQGNVLDVGCGDSPYAFLLDASKTTYYGVDVPYSDDFGYKNPNIVFFNDKDIPFEDNFFDHLYCTEVIEHVYDYPYLIKEIHRVMRPGATAVFTVPWSARFHYQPHDYFRYTPSALKQIFSQFSHVDIQPRGTDLTTLASKLVVMTLGNLLAPQLYLTKIIVILFLLVASPLLILSILLAYAGLLWSWGSPNDPIGYTIQVTK